MMPATLVIIECLVVIKNICGRFLYSAAKMQITACHNMTRLINAAHLGIISSLAHNLQHGHSYPNDRQAGIRNT